MPRNAPQPHAGSLLRRRGTRTGRGFSLIEMMVAMSIFSMLGIAIVTLLSRAADFSRAGTSATGTMDALQSFTVAFTDDAAGLSSRTDSETGVPSVRLWSDLVQCDIDGDGKHDALTRRLMFVRAVPNDATDPVTRMAGTTLGAKAVFDQANDLDESKAGKLRATGGAMEVLWTAVPDSTEDLALMTLYRGVRSPIGGPGSLFPSRVAADPAARGPADRGPVTPAEVRTVARPVLSNVLYFGVEFWARRTETWDPTIRPPKGPLMTWDSTRGVMRKGIGAEEFFYASEQKPDVPPSFGDPTDDTFPRRLRVTLVVEEPGNSARTGILMQDLSADGGTIEVSDTRFIPATDTARRFVKIGQEWIEFQSADGTSLRGCRRGARGTMPQAHASTAVVHYGRTVVREVSVATFRDAYRDELPAIGGRR